MRIMAVVTGKPPSVSVTEEPIFQAIARCSNSVMLLAADLTIRFISNPAPGLTAEQVVGTRPFDYVPEDQHSSMQAVFDEAAASKSARAYE